jgi:hypothetical protein
MPAKSIAIAFTLVLASTPVFSQSLQDFAVATYNADRSDRDMVSMIQRELASQGYYSGPIDGIWGAGTTSAANEFIGDLNSGALNRRQPVRTQVAEHLAAADSAAYASEAGASSSASVSVVSAGGVSGPELSSAGGGANATDAAGTALSVSSDGNVSASAGGSSASAGSHSSEASAGGSVPSSGGSSGAESSSSGGGGASATEGGGSAFDGVSSALSGS